MIINGSLVLIDFLNENLERGMASGNAMISGAKARFPPIMLTAITTFLGVALIPYDTSLLTQFFMYMSSSLGFGVLIGICLLMLIIPALAMINMRTKKCIALFLGRSAPYPLLDLMKAKDDTQGSRVPQTPPTGAVSWTVF